MYAQRLRSFLMRDPQVREILGENFATGKPGLREPLPLLWIEDLVVAEGSPASVRLHVFADVYQRAKALIRTIVAVLEYFEDSGPAIELETDDYQFHPVRGRVKLPGERVRFELTQDVEVRPIPDTPPVEE